MTSAASDVFISYKAEDRKRLTPLVDALEAEGFDVWWDQHIGGGTNWREEIETHLDAAKVVIVIWSKRTLGPEGRFVRDEASQAQDAGHYLPITIDNVRPPLGFREVQALDLSNWWGKRDDPRFQVLADTIRQRLEGKDIGRQALRVTGAPVSRRGVMIGGGAAAAVVAGVAGWQLLRPGVANASVAVLPFANLSGDPSQTYFSDGLAEELRSALARINGLKVIGRTSSEAVRDADAETAAKKLDVGSILTGSVRRSPSTIRVSAQLVDGSDGSEKWSQSFDQPNGDVLKIQTDIAEAVVAQLRSRLGAADVAALAIGGTKSPQAQDLVLKAQANADSSRQGFQNVIALYDAALAIDPNYADAWAGKSTMTTLLVASFGQSLDELNNGLAAGAQFARKAISLAPDSARAHYALGWNRTNALDFGGGWTQFQRALTSPGCPPKIQLFIADFCAQIGQFARANSLIEGVSKSDPLNPQVALSRAIQASYARNYPTAIKGYRDYLASKPDSNLARQSLIADLATTGQYDEALREVEKIPHGATYFVARAYMAVKQGKRADAEAVLADMRREFGDNGAYQYAEILAVLGDKDAALAQLQAALRFRDPGLVSLQTDPLFDSLRAEPRFQAIVRQLNFPKV